MAVYTPRGLKIRLSVPEAFALMTRLYPQVTPYRVLKTTEAIELIPSTLSVIFVFIAIKLELSLISVFLVVIGAHIIGKLLTTFGLFIIPGLVSISHLFSYFNGYGIFLILIFIFGGWKILLIFCATQICTFFIGNFIEDFQIKFYLKKTGLFFSASEMSFISAYRIHASRFGKITDTALSANELKENYWMEVFIYFAQKWPQVAIRMKMDE